MDEHIHTAMAIDNNSPFWIMFENLLTQLLFSTLDTL